jgi:hypothetical protein
MKSDRTVLFVCGIVLPLALIGLWWTKGPATGRQIEDIRHELKRLEAKIDSHERILVPENQR